jgi:hypothetical protein
MYNGSKTTSEFEVCVGRNEIRTERTPEHARECGAASASIRKNDSGTELLEMAL